MSYSRRGNHLLKLLKIVTMLRKKLGDDFSLGITFTRRSLDVNLQELLHLQAAMSPLLLLISHQILIILVMIFKKAWWRSCQTKEGEKVKVESWVHHLRGRKSKIWRKHHLRGSLCLYIFIMFALIHFILLQNTSSWCENYLRIYLFLYVWDSYIALTFVPVVLDDRRVIPWYDTTLNWWHLRIHLLLCVWDLLCRDILQGFVESYEE